MRENTPNHDVTESQPISCCHCNPQYPLLSERDIQICDYDSILVQSVILIVGKEVHWESGENRCPKLLQWNQRYMLLKIIMEMYVSNSLNGKSYSVPFLDDWWLDIDTNGFQLHTNISMSVLSSFSSISTATKHRWIPLGRFADCLLCSHFIP